MTLMAENNYVTQPQSHIENTVRMSIQSDLLPYRVNRPLVLEGDNDPLRYHHLFENVNSLQLGCRCYSFR